MATAPIAVVIPVYNRRLKLINTLTTVVAQSKAPALLIVVDDGSTDGSGDVAENWLARNAPFEWKVIRQANAGVAAARNRGFAEIGELPFVCFLDSDDLWPPEFLAEGLRGLEGREDAVAAVADRVKKVAGRERRVEDFRSLPADPILWLMCHDGGILSCTMIRSRAVRAGGLFIAGMVAAEDSDFLLRLFVLGPVVRSEAAAVRYIKKAPLEPTEAPNLSSASPDLPYLCACYWEKAFRRLRKHLPEEHGVEIHTSLARRWARSALSCRLTNQLSRAIISLSHALWWDHQWRRRLQLIWSVCCGNEKSFPSFKIKPPRQRTKTGMTRVGRVILRLRKTLFDPFLAMMQPRVVWGTTGFEFWTFLSLLLLHSKCSTILELGSGRSTITFAEYAKFRKAHFTSLETDNVWFKKAQAELRKTGLSEKYVVLIDWDRDKGWYKTKKFRNLTKKRFDFIFIDGPNKASGSSLGVRNNPIALSELRATSRDADVVIVDDVHRRHIFEAVDSMLSDPAQYEKLFYSYWVQRSHQNSLCICLRRASQASEHLDRIVSITGIDLRTNFTVDDCVEE
jgi:hypothetical protein